MPVGLDCSIYGLVFRWKSCVSLVGVDGVWGGTSCHLYICLFATKVAPNKEKETHKAQRRQRQMKRRRQNTR